MFIRKMDLPILTPRLCLYLDGGGRSNPDAFNSSDDCPVDAGVFQPQHVQEVADVVSDGPEDKHLMLRFV
jgi:hypothetical protein